MCLLYAKLTVTFHVGTKSFAKVKPQFMTCWCLSENCTHLWRQLFFAKWKIGKTVFFPKCVAVQNNIVGVKGACVPLLQSDDFCCSFFFWKYFYFTNIIWNPFWWKEEKLKKSRCIWKIPNFYSLIRGKSGLKNLSSTNFFMNWKSRPFLVGSKFISLRFSLGTSSSLVFSALMLPVFRGHSLPQTMLWGSRRNAKLNPLLLLKAVSSSGKGTTAPGTLLLEPPWGHFILLKSNL